MIPNPRKAVTIDFSIAELKAAVLRIPAYFHNKYQLNDQNDVFNQYTFSATEFLSAGVFMDVNLTSMSETRTEVAIEVRRKIGAFDQWHEVQQGNMHITNMTNALTKLLMNARDPRKHPIQQVQQPSFVELKAKYKIAWYWQVLIILGVALVGYLYWVSKHLDRFL